MKARLVTNDGCEKYFEVPEPAPSEWRTTSVNILHAWKYHNPDEMLTHHMRVYALMGYDTLIVGSNGCYERRAVYWEDSEWQ